MTVRWTDFAESTIASTTPSPLGTAGTTIALASGTGVRFPTLSPGDVAFIVVESLDGSQREAMRVTARTGDVLTVVRSSNPVSWSGVGQYVYCALTTEGFSYLMRASEHTVTAAAGLSAGTVQSALEALAASATGFTTSLATTNSNLSALTTTVNTINTQKPRMDVGTRALFYQAAAPTGWTLVTSVNDRVLRVSSTAGGGTGGNWTITGLVVQGHALTEAQLPAHTHGGVMVPAGNGIGPPGGGNNLGTAGSTSATGSGQTHSHGITHDGNWRPAYADVIIAERAT